MKFDEALRTAKKLFGTDVTLKRTDNARRCLVMRNGTPFGDGKSWLEALRSAGTFIMLQNEKKKVEAQRFKDLFEEFTKTTGWDVEKLTKDQLEYFDVWMKCKEDGAPVPPAPIEKPLVSLL